MGDIAAEANLAVKESRQILRLVQDHLLQTHLNFGAVQEAIDLVNVVYHAGNTLAQLNYVMPRQNTAWVPGPAVQKGLEKLTELQRRPRVCYIEGLFLPMFAKSLRDLGLEVEREVALMTCKLNVESYGKPATPDAVHIQEVSSQEGIALWWYVWRNAHYDVLTRGIEPLYVGRDMREIAAGDQADVLLYRHGFPVGVARLTIHETTGHVPALAVMKEARTPEMIRLLYHSVLKLARERGCNLVFTTGKTEEDRALCREVGFIDSGSMICYVDASDDADEEKDDVHLAQPLLVL
jgi:hypothetical protein